MGDNPLVVSVDDVESTTTAATGFGAVEAYQGLVTSIESGSWIDQSVAGLGAALTGVGAAIDPIGTLASSGVGWLIEHVEPLQEALDELAGNPEHVEAHAMTWDNVAAELFDIATDMGTMIDDDIDEWQGDAAEAYRTMADANSDIIDFIGGMALALARATRGAGELVTMVRDFVRDFVADCVGTLISWAAQIGFTLGVGATWVIPQAVTKISIWVGNIFTWTMGLIASIEALTALVGGE